MGSWWPLDATTDSEVLAYDAVQTSELGHSVLEFRQTLEFRGMMATFGCITTIVRKFHNGRWAEARWHGSVLACDLPDDMLAA